MYKIYIYYKVYYMYIELSIIRNNKQDCEKYMYSDEDDDDDPFDIAKISDITDEESILSGSSSMSYEIIPVKQSDFMSLQFGSMLSFTCKTGTTKKESSVIDSVDAKTERRSKAVAEKPVTTICVITMCLPNMGSMCLPNVGWKKNIYMFMYVLMTCLPYVGYMYIHERGETSDGLTIEVETEESEELTLDKGDGQSIEKPLVEGITLLDREENSTKLSKNSDNKQIKKVRPGRMCCFCKKVIEGGKLKRHIFTHKKTHEEVAAILKKTKQEQNKWVDEKRSEEIYLYNMTHLDVDESELMRERKPKSSDSLRMCLGCKRFFPNRTFYKHKEKCEEKTDGIKT
ncbi:hypothetical protein KUTeg_023428 [Tegillarca granosa]|uniref:C2H2-type domain-containing protein n=1 Tax=Tegillarca granosa TaxID=220873 RepID=A0ABQ9E7S5_TEGGR|nr:hypothetical protein KUTeg_023428 [Tegillarca granosa]